MAGRDPKPTGAPRMAVLMLLAALAWLAAAPAPAQPAAERVADPAYEKLLAENPADAARVREIESALANDPEAEASLAAYEDSIAANAELAGHETAYLEALDQDSLLAARAQELEEATASDAEAAGRLAAFDSLLASDAELAARLDAVDLEAAQDEKLLASQASALAQLEAHPEEAAAIFASEEAPTYTGSDPVIVVYVHYLRAHPAYYRAGWRVHDYLRRHAAIAPAVHAHGRWFGPRPQLWRAWWGWRLQAARHPSIHRAVWGRRLYLGSRPWLARQVWRHHAVIASRPALRAHFGYLHRHPVLARGVVAHRAWVHRDDPKWKRGPAKKHAPPPPAKSPKTRRR